MGIDEFFGQLWSGASSSGDFFIMYLYDKVSLNYYDLSRHNLIEDIQDAYGNIWYELDYYSHKEGRKKLKFCERNIEFVDKAVSHRIK
jgi:HEPN domain-containing protein